MYENNIIMNTTISIMIVEFEIINKNKYFQLAFICLS